MTLIRLLPASGSDTDSADCSGSVPRNLAHFFNVVFNNTHSLLRNAQRSSKPRHACCAAEHTRFGCQNVEDWGSSPHLYQLRLTLVVAPICHFCAVFLGSRDATSREKSPRTAWIDRFCRPAPLRP